MELSAVGAFVRSWFRLMLLATIAGVLVAYAASEIMPREYTAQAQVLVGSLTDPDHNKLVGYQELAQTYAQMATTSSVLGKVNAELKLSDDPADLAGRIDARVAQGQVVVRIAAIGSSGDQAAKLANAVAAEITRLARPDANTASLATVVDAASPPTVPSAPHVILNVVVGGALGFLFGLGVAGLVAARPVRAPIAASGSLAPAGQLRR